MWLTHRAVGCVCWLPWFWWPGGVLDWRGVHHPITVVPADLVSVWFLQRVSPFLTPQTVVLSGSGDVYLWMDTPLFNRKRIGEGDIFRFLWERSCRGCFHGWNLALSTWFSPISATWFASFWRTRIQEIFTQAERDRQKSWGLVHGLHPDYWSQSPAGPLAALPWELRGLRVMKGQVVGDDGIC